jgi:hypothetical protein
MSKHVPYENAPTVVVNRRYDPVLIASHVEDCVRSQVIRGSEGPLNRVEIGEVTAFQKSKPRRQRLLSGRVPCPELPQSSPRDYMHRPLPSDGEYRNLRYCATASNARGRHRQPELARNLGLQFPLILTSNDVESMPASAFFRGEVPRGQMPEIICSEPSPTMENIRSPP